jgi:formate-nitrite transporter family protein
MAKPASAAHESSVDLSGDEEDAIRELQPQRAPVLFEIIRRNGQEEIERPLQSLWWSGIAAGLSIGFSVLAPAMLKRWLPDAEWAHVISQLGYSVGFVIVILSSQQLFT